MKARLRIFLESILGPGRPAPRWLRILLIAALICGAFWYAVKALAHGQMNNTVVEYNDQRVYLHYALSMADPANTGFTPRMRMPLYPWLLSYLVRPEMKVDSLFGIAQAFNVMLSLAGLGALFLVLRRWLGAWIGLCFILVAAFQLYVLRSAYVQPEILITTLVTLAWAWLVHTLRRPTWQNGIIAGLLLCLWFLTKASAQAALALFLVILGVKWLCAGRGHRMPYALTGLVVVVSYLAPMSPYLYTSWKNFHDPFYNAQSKYYIWAEDVDDKHRLQRLNLDINLDNLPADRSTLPSLHSLLEHHKAHLFRDLKERLFKGTAIMFKLAFMEYAAFYFMTAIFAGAAVWGVWRAWPESLAALWDWKWEAIYVIGLASAFTILFGWFTPIKVGPRLIESVTLAITFFFAATAHKFLRNQSEILWGVRVSMEKLFAVLFLLFWVGLTAFQAPLDLMLGYFGG